MLGTLVPVPHTYSALHKSWTSQKALSFKKKGSQHGERPSGRLMRAPLLLCGDKGGSLPRVQPDHLMHSYKLPKLKTLHVWLHCLSTNCHHPIDNLTNPAHRDLYGAILQVRGLRTRLVQVPAAGKGHSLNHVLSTTTFLRATLTNTMRK